jgi:hypothetical protein
MLPVVYGLAEFMHGPWMQVFQKMPDHGSWDSSAAIALLFQPPGFLNDVLDFGAAKLIALEQRLSNTLNIVPIVIDKRLRAPL